MEDVRSHEATHLERHPRPKLTAEIRRRPRAQTTDVLRLGTGSSVRGDQPALDPGAKVGLETAAIDVVSRERPTDVDPRTEMTEGQSLRHRASKGQPRPEHPSARDLDGDEGREPRDAARPHHSISQVNHRSELDGPPLGMRSVIVHAVGALARRPHDQTERRRAERALLRIAHRLRELRGARVLRRAAHFGIEDERGPRSHRANGTQEGARRSRSVRCATTVPTSSTIDASTTLVRSAPSGVTLISRSTSGWSNVHRDGVCPRERGRAPRPELR